MSELLSCPGCGGEGYVRDHDFYYEGACANQACGWSAGCYDTEAEAIAAWNTRAQPAYVKRLVEAAEEANKQMLAVSRYFYDMPTGYGIALIELTSAITEAKGETR